MNSRCGRSRKRLAHNLERSAPSDILVPDAIRASPIYPPYPRAPAIDVLTAQQQVADAMRHDVLRLRSSIASLSQARVLGRGRYAAF
jgi:hypothetical protein